MSKHEEWLAAFVESGSAESLMHFNDKHDSNGRFAKKNGGSSSSVPQKPKRTVNMETYIDPTAHVSIYNMTAKNVPKSAYNRPAPSGSNVSVSEQQKQVIRNITRSLLSQSRSTGYGNNLLAGVSGYSENGYTNTHKLANSVAKEVQAAYLSNVKDSDLNPDYLHTYGSNSDIQRRDEFNDMLWNIVSEELEKEMARQGKANMPNEIAGANAKAARAEKKKGAKLTLQDRINAAYKEASNANANRPYASVQTLKGKLSGLVDKVSASAKSGKDKTSSLISKGKKYLDNAFTTTTTTYHTQAEKLGNSAKKGLTTVKTTFNTQADKLKQKKKSLFTKTKYDTGSYKNT